MDDFEAALKRFVREWLERSANPGELARHLLLAAAALLAIEDKLEHIKRQIEEDAET